MKTIYTVYQMIEYGLENIKIPLFFVSNVKSEIFTFKNQNQIGKHFYAETLRAMVFLITYMNIWKIYALGERGDAKRQLGTCIIIRH